jgi:uncharacterized repeat protein (TIGR04052 family)
MKNGSIWVVLLALTLLSVAATSAQHGGGGGMPMAMPSVGPDVTLRFAAMVGDRPASCGMVYHGVGADETAVSLNDYRFFVSNIRLIDAAGAEVPVELVQDGKWQYADVALLDFEDGTGGCAEVGNADLNDKVVGKVPMGEYTGVVFDLGLPFELNHLDTTTAPAPLNVPAMWWNWQFGYKYVRIDLLTPESETPAWFIHLGATGCVSDAPTSAPAEPCANVNVTTVQLDGFNPLENFIVADLTALVAGVNLTENTPMPPGCMSGPDDPDCVGLFPAFGLDLPTGTLIEGTPQDFFSVK